MIVAVWFVSKQEIEILLTAEPKVKSRSQHMLTFYRKYMNNTSADYFWPFSTPSWNFLLSSTGHEGSVLWRKGWSPLYNHLTMSLLPALHTASIPALIPNHLLIQLIHKCLLFSYKSVSALHTTSSGDFCPLQFWWQIPCAGKLGKSLAWVTDIYKKLK